MDCYIAMSCLLSVWRMKEPNLSKLMPQAGPKQRRLRCNPDTKARDVIITDMLPTVAHDPRHPDSSS